jgi:hypothetical protein
MAGWPHSRSGARELNSSSQNAERSGIGLKRIPASLARTARVSVPAFAQ